MEAEALKTEAAAAQPYLGWILLGVGILLVVGLGVAAWWWWNKRKKTDPSSGQKPLSWFALSKLRKQFLRALPWRYRMTVADFPTVVVLGPDDIGRTELIKKEVDWERQQRQFLPSYTESDLVKFYLGPDSVVQELSERLLRDPSVQTGRALKSLWKDSLGWRKRVLVVVAIDAQWLAGTLPDKLRAFTQLVRGKINILAELCKQPVETRICLTNLNQVEGFDQFARLAKESGIPLEITVPEADQESAQLQEALRPMEKYLSLGLMRLSLKEFKLLEQFLQHGSDKLATSLSNLIVALREGRTLSAPPVLERVYLTPDPERSSVGAFTLVAEKKNADLAKHNRWVHLRNCALLLAVGCLPVLAAYGHFLGKLRLAEEAVDSFSTVVARLQSQGLEVSGTVIHDESQNAMSAMHGLDSAERFWPPLRTSFADERADLRLRMADTLRVSYFKPALERCQAVCSQCGSQIPGCPAVKGVRPTCPAPKEPPLYRYDKQCRPEQMLYFRAVLRASRADALGNFILDSFDEGVMGRWNWASEALGLHVANQEKGSDENWVDLLHLDEEAAGDYIVMSDEPWSPTPEDLRTWVRWPYQGLTYDGQVGPWREHFERLSGWLETEKPDLEEWDRLQQERQELEQLLDSAQQYQSARRMLDELNAAPSSDSASTLEGVDTTLRALEWMRDQRAPLAAVLALEAEADAALQEGLKMSPAQLLTQTQGLFEPSFVTQIDLVVLRHRFVFDPPEVSQQLLDKLLNRLEESPELDFGKGTPGSGVVSAGGSSADQGGVLPAGGMAQGSSAPVKGRAEFDSELKPLVDGFTQRLAKANMSQEEAAKREAYVLGKVSEFAAGYRQSLVSTFNRYQFNANRNTLLSELSTLVQPSSPLVAMLREVANLASIGPLQGPYYEPLRSAIEPFKPVTQLMTPDKDGNYAALGQYILLVAQLHGELSGTRPSPDEATASKASGDKASGDKGDASGKDEGGSAPKAAAAGAPESQLPELLTPAGRVALSMLLGDEDSYLKQVDAWLDKQGILGEFRTPFRQPFLMVRNLGRDDLEKVIKEQWTAERKRVLEPLFKRYPFNPESQQEIDPAELMVLRRKDGEFWVFVDQVLSPLIVERGSEWSLRGPLRNQVMLPARMLSTLNFLSRLSRGLWDDQGKPAAMAMQLRPLPLPLAPSQGEFVTMSYLKCGGASAFGFNQSPAWQDFSLSWWDQRAASLGVELRSPARSAKRYRTVEMPSSSWSCFRLMELGSLTGEQNMVWELPGPNGQPNTPEVLAVSFGMRGSPLPLFRGVPK